MRGDRVRPRKANAGAMRKNAIAAHDDSHRTKNSLTGIASTPSFGEGTARKRRGNADEHACRHGDIRPPQELTDGDGHRGQNGSHDIAARQSLRKEQADKERCADKTRKSGGNIDNGAGNGTQRARNAPCCDEDRIEYKGLTRTPIRSLNQLGKRDAICLLGECRGNSQRLTL